MFKSTERMLNRYRRANIARGIVTVIVFGVLIVLLVIIGAAIIGDVNKLIPTDSHELRLLLKEAAAENVRRVSTVETTCRRYNLGIYHEKDDKNIYRHPPAPQYAVLYIDKAHNLSYCPVYKAGSTTWLYNLCLLNGITEEELTNTDQQISTIARRVLPEIEFPEAEKLMKKSAKLLVVRHPFERLLSAYRDKLENSVAGREHGTYHFYKKFGSKIVQKFRDDKIAPPRPDQVIRKAGIRPPAGIEPSWREFVQYLIQTDLASYGDDHWMPYYLFCTPCIMKFDLIAKVETLWRDQIFAIYELGVENKLKPRWRHSSGSNSEAAKIYFSQLSHDLVQKLYEKFKLDFELFDYSPMDYYQYATPDVS